MRDAARRLQPKRYLSVGTALPTVPVGDVGDGLVTGRAEVVSLVVGDRDQSGLHVPVVGDAEQVGGITLEVEMLGRPHGAEAAGAGGEHEAPGGRQDRSPDGCLIADRGALGAAGYARNDQHGHVFQMLGQVIVGDCGLAGTWASPWRSPGSETTTNSQSCRLTEVGPGGLSEALFDHLGADGPFKIEAFSHRPGGREHEVHGHIACVHLFNLHG